MASDPEMCCWTYNLASSPVERFSELQCKKWKNETVELARFRGIEKQENYTNRPTRRRDQEEEE
jgi:hypothetical protein